MKFAASKFPIYLLVSASLTTFNLPALQWESHCPGSIASVTPRLIAGALVVIPVTVNGRGTFDFMVDTGSQVTVVDPALAQELRLTMDGSRCENMCVFNGKYVGVHSNRTRSEKDEGAASQRGESCLR
jgi:Aspartyl protease